MNSTATETRTAIGYVDGFVIPMPTQNLEAYRKLAETAATVWREHGALDYVESVAEDVNCEGGVPFPKLAGTHEGETVVFAYITYRDRAHRDEVNAKVMADPRIQEVCPDKNPDAVMPFDCARMTYGGFRTLVTR